MRTPALPRQLERYDNAAGLDGFEGAGQVTARHVTRELVHKPLMGEGVM